MILGGLKDFQCQKWVYSHAKDEETAYLEQLEKICRKIEIDENNYFFYPYSKTLHRFFPTHAMNILSITPAYEEVLATDFAAMGENRVVRALKILVDRVTEKQSCVVRFMEAFVGVSCILLILSREHYRKFCFFMRCFGKWSMGIMAWGDWIWLCSLTIRKILKRGGLREKKLKSFFGR